MDADPIVAIISALSGGLVAVIGAWGVRAAEIKRRERRQSDVPAELREAIRRQEEQHQAALEQHREMIAVLKGLQDGQARLLAILEKLAERIADLRVDVARKP